MGLDPAISDRLEAHSRPCQQPPSASAIREFSLSRMLMAYVTSGMAFMLLPGTFLGVWNLLSISSKRSPDSLPPGWVQAHGHAQIFGWIGTFIIGIGYYSIPKLRRGVPRGIAEGWVCLILWTVGVATRWAAGTYEWGWRLLLPLSAVMELLAFLIFFRSVAGHRPEARDTQDRQTGLEPASDQPEKKGRYAWVIVVIFGTIGLLFALILNLIESAHLAFKGTGPAFPHEFDLRFLAVSTWGFLVPFVWGFTSRWMPAFMGLKTSSTRLLFSALLLNTAGVALALLGRPVASALFLLCSSAVSLVALRLFDGTRHPAKTRTVSAWFPTFVRIAFLWSLIAAALGVWASLSGRSSGIAGASRHALTVGFISMMVFSVSPRVLPAFTGLHELYSANLMSASLGVLTIGCAIRVSCEIVAYQGYAKWGWSLLPVSAIIEMIAVTLFGLNMAVTLLRPPLVPATAVRVPAAQTTGRKADR